MAQEIPLRGSPSLLYQNLSFSDGKFVYVHGNQVHTLALANREPSSIQVKDKVPITHARVCTVAGQNMLVLASPTQSQFWDLSREKLLFTINHEEEGKDFLCRGIASVGNLVFVGHSSGSISVFECRADGGAKVRSLKEHKDMITDIASGELNGEPVVVSADIAGEVLIWDGGMNLKARIDKTAGDTASCIAITPTHIACGYGSGKIRIFNGQGKKCCEIAAHCRWIYSVAYCAASNTLASGGEDMLVQFWKMPSATDPKVALKGSYHAKDALVCGVAFAEAGKVGCTAYDTEKLFLIDVQ